MYYLIRTPAIYVFMSMDVSHPLRMLFGTSRIGTKTNWPSDTRQWNFTV